jgi:hypothetical protein
MSAEGTQTSASSDIVIRQSYSPVDLRLQRGAAWTGLVMVLLLLVFFLIIGKLIPPFDPTDGADKITQFLVANKLRIRLGVTLSLIGATLMLPFLAVICARIWRVEGRFGILTAGQLLASAYFVPGFWVSLMSLATALFRPESRSHEITQAFTDMFWLMFVGIAEVAVAQAVILAIAAFVDRGTPRTFPRWFGYFNIWYALLTLPGALVVLFNDGPLAWNGVFAFWIPLTVFSVWLITTMVVLLRSIGAEERAEAAVDAA